jgi:transposase, IS5 family
MRRVVPDFDLFVSPVLPHEHARELETIDRILRDNPAIARLVWEDIGNGAIPEGSAAGRPGLSAEQVLRAAIIRQMNGFSYEALAFHVADSRTYLRFCGFRDPREVPKKSSFAENIKRLSAQVWQKIHPVLTHYAESRGIEDGQKVRIDPTVTESNILHPTDNGLLFDCVEVLARILERARESFGISFRNRVKRAKRHHMAVLNAKNNEQRTEPYEKLLDVTRRMICNAEDAIAPLRREKGAFAGLAHHLADQLEHYLPLARRVVSQTERRVLQGESVPAEEKLVSIFEPHTDIIRKDNRATYYGHKVTFTGGASGLVLDWVVEDGNPADVTLFVRMLDRQKFIYGHYPRQVAADGCLTSKENLQAAKDRGVVDIAFSKRRGLSIDAMASSVDIYRKLRNFRAGIEATISFLKRVFGLRRCIWKGAESFASYVGAAVVSANLLILARHLMN